MKRLREGDSYLPTQSGGLAGKTYAGRSNVLDRLDDPRTQGDFETWGILSGAVSCCISRPTLDVGALLLIHILLILYMFESCQLAFLSCLQIEP